MTYARVQETVHEVTLPESWTFAALGEVLDVVRGVSFPSSVKRFESTDSYIACLRTANVQLKVDWGNLWFVPEEYLKRHEQLVQVGDILISTANSFELVGKVAQVSHVPTKSTLGAFISLIRVPEQLDAAFFYFLLSAAETQESIRRLASTTTNISNVSIKKLKTLALKVPPLNEQRRIVEKIEELFTKLDAGVESLRRTQALLKQYRQSILKAAVTGELSREWREAHADELEPASELLMRILNERREKWTGKKYKEPIEPDTSDLLSLPYEWTWVSWDQIGTSQNGRAFPSKEYSSDGVKLLRPGNLHESGAVRWTEKNKRYMPPVWAEKHQSYLVGPRELVINLTAQSLADDFLGRVCLTDAAEHCLLNQRIARLTPIQVLPEYLLWTFKSPIFREFVKSLNTGSLIQHMFTSQLAEAVLPLPPMEEQCYIVGEIERRLSIIANLQATVEKNLKRSERLRQSILKQAFSGQLVPQDLDDEPASVLLERIREKRLTTNQKVRKRRVTKETEPLSLFTDKEG